MRSLIVLTLLLSGCSKFDTACEERVQLYRENLREDCRLDIRYKRCQTEVLRDQAIRQGNRLAGMIPEDQRLTRREIRMGARMLCTPEYEECLERTGYGRITEKETCQ